MEYLIFIIFLFIVLIILGIIYKIDIKQIKKIGNNNKELDELVNKYPKNIEICETILKMLKNENVNIEENKDANNCLYIAISNKIIIANMKNSFTRIQTIAHECLHSIQDRRILLFNFIYSNIYIIYFIAIIILGLFKVLPSELLFLGIYIILGFIYYFIRSYLENDAMLKARFLAEKYMKKVKISNDTEIEKIINEYDKLNNLGIKTINYGLFAMQIVKIIILTIVFWRKWGRFFFDVIGKIEDFSITSIVN